jgi:IS5 family transposase
MRRRFEAQLALGTTPIERVSIPVQSRDELPRILATLQWIFQTPEINEQIFALLEARLKGGKKAIGRPGLDLWHILVLGVVRLGLHCNYIRLEDMANHHTLLRQILGLNPVRSPAEKPFHFNTLAENIGLVDEDLLAQINTVIEAAGRKPFRKKGRHRVVRSAP